MSDGTSGRPMAVLLPMAKQTPAPHRLGLV